MSVLLAVACAAPFPALAQPLGTPGVSANRPDQNPAAVRESQGASVRTPPAARARQAAITPFVLRAVAVDNSTLPAEALARAWRPFVGRTIDAEGLVEITDALAAAYATHDIAIFTIAVPNQTFEGGVMHVQALEGHIDAVQVTGAEGPRQRRLIDRYLARLTAERPLRQSTLQRYVSLMRDIPGLEVQMDLRNGRSDDGVLLVVALYPHPLQVGLSLNNRGTAYLGRTQGQADVYLNSLIRDGDRTRLTVAAPIDTERFQTYALEHSQPIGADGLTLTANLGYLRTQPAGVPILGHATSAGLQLSYPLVRSYDRNVYVTLGVDGINADNAFLGFTFSDERTRAVRAAISYSRQTERRLFYATGAFTQGIDGLGARTVSGLADPDFRKLNVKGGANFAIGQRWAVRFASAGQWTADRLPGTEQFTLGGDEFGRGYSSSIIAGDYGFAGSAELAWRPAGLPQQLSGSEAYAFADGGKVWYRARFDVPTESADLRSAGVGVRAAIGGKAIVQLEAAKGLGNRLPLLDDRGWRGVFSIRTLF